MTDRPPAAVGWSVALGGPAGKRILRITLFNAEYQGLHSKHFKPNCAAMSLPLYAFCCCFQTHASVKQFEWGRHEDRKLRDQAFI